MKGRSLTFANRRKATDPDVQGPAGRVLSHGPDLATPPTGIELGTRGLAARYVKQRKLCGFGGGKAKDGKVQRIADRHQIGQAAEGGCLL